MSAEQRLIRECLEALTFAQLEWAILHGADRLPERGESDVDIVVRNADLTRVTQVLRHHASRIGGRLVQVIQHESTAVYHVLVLPLGDGFSYLKLDACGDYRRDGVVLFTPDELLKDASLRAGLPCVSTTCEVAYYFAKRVLKDRWDDGTIERLQELRTSDPTAFESGVRFVAPHAADSVVRALDLGDADALRAAGKSARRDVLGSAWARHPIGCLLYRVREVGRILNRVTRPTGLHVVILGPDGVGKTTVLERAIPALSHAFRKVEVRHLRPGILPSRTRSEGPTMPYQKPPYPATLALLKLAYLWSDYTLGYFLRVFPAKTRSTLILYDRYFADLMADPERYRYRGHELVVGAAVALSPAPDLYVVLDADTSRIQARKSEMSAERTDQLRAAYLSLPRRLTKSHAVVIDANGEPDVIARRVAESVLDALVARDAGNG